MIYLIEDDTSVRRSLEFYLESAGLEYKSFGSAISFLSDGMATIDDLIVLDLNLPEMSGLELLDRFSQENKKIPVIVVTALYDAHSFEHCRQYGVLSYLQKPVSGATLIDIINADSRLKLVSKQRSI
jgi:two-component system, LuxR family, response regulator FixJ